MEYFNRLSNLVASPAKSANNIKAARRRKASVQISEGSPEAFKRDWDAVKNTLQKPDERALFFGIERTDVPDRLSRMVDALVFESNRTTDGHTGPCMEHLLKHELLEELVHLSAQDQPSGIKGEVIRMLANLVILLDEKFLSRQAAHKPISMLIDLCIAGRGADDDDHDDLSFAAHRARRRIVHDVEADYHGDLVELMSHVASRIRNTPDLLLIFFSDEKVRARSMDEIVESNAVVVFAGPAEASISEAAQPDRPPSPAGSIDSVATLQPTKIGANAKEGALYRKLKFPLFSHLLRFAHREGRTGELARAGLLFLITLEVNQPHSAPRKGGVAASNSDGEALLAERAQAEDLKTALATFVANSDFADVFGAGLGAAYGLLPTRIYMAPVHDPTSGPTGDPALGQSCSEIALGSAAAASEPEDHSSASFSTATRSDDPELQAQLRLLVDLLDFAQDVLDAVGVSSSSNPQPGSQEAEQSQQQIDAMIEKLAMSVAIAARDTFIKNVVYPSLMESSDIDGSAVAVMSYLDVVMMTLREKHMLTEVILQYLLCYERLPTDDAHFDEAGATASRLAYRLADDGADRYSLKDLILDNMDSNRAASAITAAMKLARSIIVNHGRHANDALLETKKVPHRLGLQGNGASHEDDGGNVWGGASSAYHAPESLQVAPLQVAQHLREIDAYAALLARFEDSVSPEMLLNSLSPYLLDAEQAIRHDSSFEVAIRPFSQRQQEIHSHGERTDPAHWYQVRLSPKDAFLRKVCELLARLFRQPPEENLALTGVITALALSPVRSLKGWLTFDAEQGAATMPAVLDLFSHLSRQVEEYRKNVPDFDRYLAERRKGLLLSEDLSDALELSDLIEDDGVVGEKVALGEAKAGGLEAEVKKMAPSLSLPRHRPAKAKPDAVEGVGAAPPGMDLKVVEDLREKLPLEASAANGGAAARNEADAMSTADEAKPPPSDSRSSALARLFGGRSMKAASAGTSSQPNGQQGGRGDRSAVSEAGKVASSTLSPYTRHYQETLAVFVQAATVGGADEWRRAVELRATDAGEADVDKVTLSSVLDNSILLEELIKEVLAIIEVRRAWGIDPVSFGR
ncbi:hypothetical protein ACQY0O_004462 [Thecaphora frezii]